MMIPSQMLTPEGAQAMDADGAGAGGCTGVGAFAGAAAVEGHLPSRRLPKMDTTRNVGPRVLAKTMGSLIALGVGSIKINSCIAARRTENMEQVMLAKALSSTKG